MDPTYKNIREIQTIEQIFSLKGKVGLITGGTGKMGQQFVKTLSLAGADLVVSDLDESKCQGIADLIRDEIGTDASGVGCDVSKKNQVESLFEFIEKKYGRLDFFISNIMGKPEGYYRQFESYPEETWTKVIDINLKGTFLCCQEAAKIMKKQRTGSIMITASIYGIVGPDQRIYKDCSPTGNPYGGGDPLNAPGAYSASKGGLVAFAKYLATLLGHDGIRVNVLVPGGVYDGQDEQFHKAYVERVPLGRMGVWSDYNGAALFLVGDASRYMTGSVLSVDGGWTAW